MSGACDAFQGGFKQALFKLFLFNIKYTQLKTVILF